MPKKIVALQWLLDLPRPGKRIVALLADALFLALSLWAAWALRFEDASWLPTNGHLLLFGGTVALTIAAFIKLGLYRAVIRFISEKALLAIIAGVALSAAILIILGYLLQVPVPRSVPVIYAAFAFLFVAGTRFAIRGLVQYPRQRSRQAVLVAGTGETGMQLALALGRGTEFRPAGFVSVDEEQDATNIAGLPVYGVEKLRKAIREHDVTRVLLALDDAEAQQRKRLLAILEPLSVAVQTVPSMSELVSGKARINDIRDLEIEDLLGRDPVRPDLKLLAESITGKVVMVTGAGGSIGSELCRQILRHKPRVLVLFEQSEFALYSIERELATVNTVNDYGVDIQPLLGSVVHRRRCEAVMRAFSVNAVYHAAAYKHVPLVEHNIIEGVQNNVFGTWHAAEAAVAAGVERFVLISTDKAVRPTNVMGASKRMAELVLQALARRQEKTVFSMVRFGNVLGSSGSVVPLFRDQIRDGGPVTVTHPDIIRYFMTIPEASQLVLQAGAMGQGGEVFVLDMGEPVKIADLARKMIHLMGLTEKTDDRPEGDIRITFTGLRPGEKLFEELLIGDDPQGTAHARIMKAREVFMPWEELEALLEKLKLASTAFDCQRVIDLILEAPTGYNPNGDVADLVWCNGQPFKASEEDLSGKVRRLN
ncbi:MAG: polysaccharide biosynthesis protein [Marinobacter sp.]|nr:polysaccharide biosynthesis protein [Marinobacter sp.]